MTSDGNQEVLKREAGRKDSLFLGLLLATLWLSKNNLPGALKSSVGLGFPFKESVPPRLIKPACLLSEHRTAGDKADERCPQCFMSTLMHSTRLLKVSPTPCKLAIQPAVRMLAAERRYERAADQVVGCVDCKISEQLLTAEI